MADRTKARWDTMTLEQYRRIHGEPPRDAPRPWWMISGEKPPPESPTRLVVGAQPHQPGQSHQIDPGAGWSEWGGEAIWHARRFAVDLNR